VVLWSHQGKKGMKRQKNVRQISESSSVFGQLGYGWRTQTFIPSGSRKDEQGFLDAQEALCLIPAFRRDIQELRKRYPDSYWEQGRQANREAEDLSRKWQNADPHWILWLVRCWNFRQSKTPPLLPLYVVGAELSAQQKKLCNTSTFRTDIQSLQERYPTTYWAQGRELDSEAEALCQRWGIDGLHWVLWLAEHWDPDLEKLPAVNLRDDCPWSSPVLGSWSLKVESVKDNTKPAKTGKPLRAILTLYAGISLRDAHLAAKVALEALGPNRKLKGARPGLTNIDRAHLRREFKRLGLPMPRKRTQMARTVARRMKQIGRSMRESAVRKELYKWLREHGQSVKMYAH
jgi:hypothetical protein